MSIISGIKICTCIFQQVDQKRSKKVSGSRVTKAQKNLKKKSGCRVTPQMEHEVLYLLNTLAGKPELLQIPDAMSKGNSRVEMLQAELENLLGMLPVDESQARQKLMETTVAMYEAMEETALQTAIMEAVNKSMDPGGGIARDAAAGFLMILKPQENAEFTLGEVKRRIQELNAEFDM